MIDLPTAKAHLRVTQSHEDALIQGMVNGAADAVAGHIDRTLVETVSTDTATAARQQVWTPALEQAVLLMVGTMYLHREMSIPLRISDNPAVEMLLQPYRNPGI